MRSSETAIDRIHLKMPHQQDLFPPETSNADDPTPRPVKAEEPPAPLWLQRVSVVILVVFCFYVGVLLFVLPWTRYWQENHYLLTMPTLGPLMNSGMVRGVISGLGLIDVWIGISEILHYREFRG